MVSVLLDLTKKKVLNNHKWARCVVMEKNQVLCESASWDLESDFL